MNLSSTGNWEFSMLIIVLKMSILFGGNSKHLYLEISCLFERKMRKLKVLVKNLARALQAEG